MELKELIAVLLGIFSIVLAVYLAVIKNIESAERIAMERIQADKIRDKERIEAIVDLRVVNKTEEMKKPYNEMIQLLKGGTFK
jgi:hypothetical protein